MFVRGGKVNVVEYWRIVDDMITLQMVLQLKPKILMLYQQNITLILLLFS